MPTRANRSTSNVYVRATQAWSSLDTTDLRTYRAFGQMIIRLSGGATGTAAGKWRDRLYKALRKANPTLGEQAFRNEYFFARRLAVDFDEAEFGLLLQAGLTRNMAHSLMSCLTATSDGSRPGLERLRLLLEKQPSSDAAAITKQLKHWWKQNLSPKLQRRHRHANLRSAIARADKAMGELRDAWTPLLKELPDCERKSVRVTLQDAFERLGELLEDVTAQVATRAEDA